MSKQKKTAKKAQNKHKVSRRDVLAFFGMEWLDTTLKLLKYVLLFLLCVLLPAAALVLFALQCRRGHKGLETLKKYRYAHRGLHHDGKPENSLAAFQEALNHGYGAELDVHLMKDGELAVIHDSHLGRMCGADTIIEEMTAADLPNLKLDYTDETVPLFEDVLKLFNGRPEPLIVELKVVGNNYKELTEKTMQLLDQYDVCYCIESFDSRVLNWLRINRPEVIRGQLSADLTSPDLNTGGSKKFSLFMVQHLLFNFMACPDFIAYDFSSRSLPELKLCRKLYHVQEVSWTIRTREDMEAAEKLGNIVIFENFGWE